MTLSREALEVIESQIKLYEDLAKAARNHWAEHLPPLPADGKCPNCDLPFFEKNDDHVTDNLWWWEVGYTRMSKGFMYDPDYTPKQSVCFYSDGWDDMSESGDCAWVCCASCQLAFAVPDEVDWS